MSFDAISGQLTKALFNGASMGLGADFESKIGGLFKPGGLPAAGLQNLLTLNSPSMTLLDRVSKAIGFPEFRAAFTPHRCCDQPHLDQYRGTYVQREQVGRAVDPNNILPGCLRGFSGKLYAASFRHPIGLPGGNLLYMGRKYENWQGLQRDIIDGKIDGIATRRGGWNDMPIGWPPPPPGPEVKPEPNAESSDILSNPGYSLEEKLMLLLAKFQESVNKELEGQMKQLDSSMKGGAAEGAGAAGGAQAGEGKGGGGDFLKGLFQKALPIIGAAVGIGFGGPFGAQLGSMVGGMASELIGRTGATKVGEGAIGRTGATKVSEGGAGETGGAEKPDRQTILQKIQILAERKKEMFETISNIMKSFDSSSNAIIGNMRG
jgi:hypothetical protein